MNCTALNTLNQKTFKSTKVCINFSSVKYFKPSVIDLSVMILKLFVCFAGFLMKKHENMN